MRQTLLKTSALLNFRKAARGGLALLACLVLFTGMVKGQASGYTAVRTTATYAAISGGTSYCSTTCNGLAPSAVALPWTFVFNGVGYSSINISENGFITFGTAPSNANVTPISSSESSGVISVFGINNTATGGRSVVYRNNGTSFSIEWIRAGTGGGLAGTHLDAKITLFQTTNVIEFTYRGPASYPVNSTLNGQVGLRGTTPTDFRNLTTLTAAPGYGAVNTATATYGTANYTIVNNTKITWTPPSFCTAPTTNASGFTVTDIQTNQESISFTRGSGDAVLVVARAGSPAGGPATGATYSASSVYGSGAPVGGGFAVFNGTGSSVTVTGLTPGTTYYYSIYEYVSATNCYSVAPLTGSVTTLDPSTTSSTTISCAYSGASQSIPFSTIVGSAGATTVVSGFSIDDNVYPNRSFPAGFNFNFNGTDFTSLGISSNGFVWFGTGTASTTNYTPISSVSVGSGTINGVISAFGQDIIAHPYLSAAPYPPQITTTTIGSSPNRIFVVEWTGFSPFSSSYSCNAFAGYYDEQRLDFQVRIYENGGTNAGRIEMSYRDQNPFCVNDTYTGQVGIRGVSNTEFANRTQSSGHWTSSSTVAGTANTDAMTLTSSRWINGTDVGVRYNRISSTPTISPSPTATNSCPGTTVLLTASAGTNYQWFKDGTLIPYPAGQSATYTATASGSYIVRTGSPGCYAVSSPTTVTITTCCTPPALTANASPNPVCAGGPQVTLTISSSGGGCATPEYAWQAPGGQYWNGSSFSLLAPSYSSSYSSITFTPPGSGTYTALERCSTDFTCTASTTVSVTVAPTPTLTYTSTDVSCFGGSNGAISIFASTGGATTFSINGGGSYQASNSFTGLSAGTYQLRVKSGPGCESAITMATLTEPAQLVASIAAGGATTFCSPGCVTLTASSTGGTGSTTYLWSTGATTASISACATDNYSVTVTDANSCTSTASQSVTVNGTPSVTISASGPTTFCSPGCVSLTANATGGSGGYAYLWSTGATTSTISACATGTYSVTVTSAGCTGSASQSVTVNPTPVATITPSGPTTFCTGGSVTLSAGPSGMTYLWSTGATTQNITVSATGTYSVTVTSAGCSSSASQTVTVNTNPTVTISSSGPTTFCGPGCVTLTANASGGAGGYSYLWSTGATTASISACSTGTYSVTVASAGCTGTASQSVTVSSFAVTSPIFTETMGTSPVTLSIATYEAGNLYDNDAFTMTGTGDMRNTSASTGAYPGASGLANVFLTNTNTNFQIAGINTSVWSSFSLAFGLNKSTIASDGTELIVEASSDGITYTPIPFTPLPTGTGTAIWHAVTIPSAAIPSAPNVRLRFRNTSVTGPTGTMFRVDDIVLTGTSSAATITPTGPTSFCAGGGVNLVASLGASWLWSNGATTQVINANTTGSYSVTITDGNGCTAVAGPVSVTVWPQPTVDITSTNATCAGTCNGSATAVVTGGTSPFSYSWSTGATTPSVSSLCAGTYSVSISDAHGCNGAVPVFFETTGPGSGPTAIAIWEAGNNFDNDAQTMTGGTGTDVRQSNSSAGFYPTASGGNHVFIDNISGAFFQISGINTLGAPGAISLSFGISRTPATTGADLSVQYSTDGVTFTSLTMASLGTTGATPVWQYRTLTGVVPASATLTLRFTNTGSATDYLIDDILLSAAGGSESVTITAPPALVANCSAPVLPCGFNIACNGACTGTINASATGGTGAYQYSIDGGTFGASGSFTGLCAGSHTVTVKDANGCTTTCSSTLTQSPAVTITCPGTQTLVLNASCGGTLPNYTSMASTTYTCGTVTFTQSPAAGTAVSGVGTTVVTITGTSACGTVNCSFNVNRVDNTAPNALCQDITVNLDASGNASITAAMVNGGSSDGCGPVTLSATPLSFDCGDVDGSAGGLFISEYIEGTSNNKAIEIYNGTGGPVNLAAGGYQLRQYFNGNTVSGLNIVLTGTIADGDVYVVAQSSANAAILAQADQTSAAGFFNGDDAVALVQVSGSVVTFRDIVGQIGCDPGTTWNLGGNQTEDMTIRRNASVNAGVGTNPSGPCSASSFTTLGSEWASFGLDNSAGLGSHTMTSTGTNPVVLTVTDPSGNTSSCTSQVTVRDVTAPAITCPGAVTVSCDASSAPSATGTATATDACGVASITSSDATTAGSCAGNYTITRTWTATDVNGNSSSCTQTITVQDITSPVIGTAAAGQTVECDGSGNTAALNAWLSSHAGASATDNCGTVSWTNNFTSLSDLCGATGTATVIFTASDDCGNTATTSATFTITDTQAPSVTAASDQTVECDGSGNTAQLNAWLANNGGATATDACSGVTWTNDYSGLSDLCGATGAATVTFTATDDCGNATSTNATFTIEDTQAPAITCPAALAFECEADIPAPDAGLVSSSDVCGGSTNAFVGETNNGGTGCPGDPLVITRTYSATDDCGNTSTCTQTITVESTPVLLTLVNPPYGCGYSVSCNGASDGRIVAMASGGCAPYTYLWSNGATTQFVTGLSAGSYSVTLTDANGCSYSESITLTQPDALEGSGVVSTYSCGYNVSCNGSCDGSINLSVNGGCAPYSFTWSNGATTEDVSGLCAGTYTVSITDVNGCTTSSSFTLTQPAALTGSLSPSMYACGYNISCYGTASGSVSTTVAGGCAPYTFSWSNGSGTQDVMGLPAGTYVVTITDANGCVLILTQELTQPSPLVSSGVAATYSCGTNVSCYGACDGSINLSASGGADCVAYNYAWSNGATTQDVSGLCAGSHSVTVTDANGCISVSSFTLTQPTPVVVDAGANATVYPGYPALACKTLTGTAATGGCGPYTYTWSTSAGTVGTGLSVTVCPTVSTTYYFTATDVNGCTGRDSVRVCAIDVICGHSGGGPKITICHLPPTTNATMCVPMSSVSGHLGHGDYIGPCTSSGTHACDWPAPAKTSTDATSAEAGDALSMSAYPNPFNSTTTVEFTLSSDEHVSLKVYSITGVEVGTLFEGYASSGMKMSYQFNPQGLSEGIYIARLTTQSGHVQALKLVLQR